MDLSLAQIALLVAASLIAGTIDAIAGGGGLITLPALLAAGLPPHLALGTNKGQSVFGSFAATARFWHAGTPDRSRARVNFPLALVGALLGAQLVVWIRPEVLRPVVLVMLPLAAAAVVLRPANVARLARVSVVRGLATSGAIALVVGTYDGFFGPGTGTFLIMGFVALLGLAPVQASADAKIVNFASNLAAVGLFASKGLVLWKIALPMAVAQFAGGWLGAHLTLKGGDRLVRVCLLVVVAALFAKIARDFL